MATFFLKGNEKMIDHIKSIREFGGCFWEKTNKKGTKKWAVGDYIYLFLIGKGHNQVRFRLRVSDIDCERIDQNCWLTKFKPDEHCFMLENTASMYQGDNLSYTELEAHDISRHIVDYLELSQEQADWLESHFK